MTTAIVLLQYKQRILEHQMAFDGALSAQRFAAAAALAALLLVVAGWLACSRRAIPAWSPAVPLPVVVLSLRAHARRRAEAHRIRRLLGFYQRGEDRLEDRWAGKGQQGQAFEPPAHPYAGDLNLFGEGSVFERICTARTHLGRERLAHYLLEPAGGGEVLARQEAVRELRGQVALREKMALLGHSDFEDSHWASFARWLQTPRLAAPWWLRPLLLVTSSCLLALLVGVVAAPEAWHLAAAPVLIVTAIHLSAGALLFRGVRAALSAAGPVAGEMAVLREGLALLAAQQFQSPKLRALAARVTEAGRTVGDLELWFGVLRERTKDWFLHLSLWMAAGTQTALALDAWRSRHAAALPEWLDAWAEFEALQSLACYAYENQEDCWPEVREGKPRFEASALGHPLLSRARCVANDVRLGEEPAFWVISGSNMAGKSTLLRSVGLACVLSQAGAPVRAARLTLSTLRVHASISILDSLQRGTSRFLAEVERLRDTLQAASHGPVLFLFDEIFSGTNSSDRHIAADAVVGALKERGAIGAVTTHDIALASIARHGGKNVHMASAGGGPLDFDYLVKPGVTPETNAIAIARMAGVPV